VRAALEAQHARAEVAAERVDRLVRELAGRDLRRRVEDSGGEASHVELSIRGHDARDEGPAAAVRGHVAIEVLGAPVALRIEAVDTARSRRVGRVQRVAAARVGAGEIAAEATARQAARAAVERVGAHVEARAVAARVVGRGASVREGAARLAAVGGGVTESTERTVRVGQALDAEVIARAAVCLGPGAVGVHRAAHRAATGVAELVRGARATLDVRALDALAGAAVTHRQRGIAALARGGAGRRATVHASVDGHPGVVRRRIRCERIVDAGCCIEVGVDVGVDVRVGLARRIGPGVASHAERVRRRLEGGLGGAAEPERGAEGHQASEREPRRHVAERLTLRARRERRGPRRAACRS
jgi:hypothetical protein